MRLIDADALIEEIDKLPTTPLWHDMQKEGVIWEILNAPTVATDTNVLGKLTDEAAIEHLQASGWMQRHDRAMSRPPWVSVDERLPELQAQCLVYSAKDSIPRGMVDATYTEFGWITAAYFPEVTHWMPLPEPPKEEESDATD